MASQILFVDDDANILAAYRRKFRQYELETSQEPEKALETIRTQGPYAVVVADMQMPKMNGVEFLKETKHLAPDATRVMLTGNADQQTAIDAVNRGAIFRFLTKPCPTELFTATIDDAIEQHRLVTAEKELLQKTLRGSIKVLIDLLAMVNPDAFGLAMTLKTRAAQMAKAMDAPRPWEIEIAAMLYPIGQITLPEDLRERVIKQEPLTAQERHIIAEGEKASQKLLGNIPRLESICRILEHVHDSPKLHVQEQDAPDERPLSSLILKALIDFAAHEAAGKSIGEALTLMRKKHAHQYDPVVLERLTEALVDTTDTHPQLTEIFNLEEGFILAQDVKTDTDILLIRKGATVSEAVKLAMRNYHALGHLDGPVMAIHAGPFAENKPPDAARQAS